MPELGSYPFRKNTKISHTVLCNPPAPSRLSQLSVQDMGSQEFDVETSSVHSSQGHEADAVSLGSRASEHTPTCAVVLYGYTVRE